MTASMRSIEVVLKANVAQFTTGLGVAGAEAKKFGRNLSGVGDTAERDLRKVSAGATAVGGVMVAGFGLAAGAALKFDKQMSEVGAVAGATGGQLGSLRQAALDAGQATVFSATEAAQAEAELAKAGVSTADILGGALTGALNLASAGNLDLAKAAELSAAAMTTFGLHGSDVPHIADVMSAAANKSAAGVEDMGLALQQSGLVAAQLGLTLEDTSGVLAMFAQAGLKGSDAGTSLKTALQRFVPQSAEAAAAMKALGLDFFDAQGQFIGIDGAAEQLHDKLSGLTQEARASALQTIFGADAIRAATILYQQGGAGVKDWTGKVNDAGYAAELAAKKNDNLAGDLEQLRGSIETGLIQGGSSATTVLRGLASGATDFVNGISSAPGVLGGVATGFVGIAGGGTALLGIIGTVAPKIEAARTSLESMGKVGQLASSGIGSVGGALALAAPGIIYATQLWGQLQQNAEEAYKTFTKDWKPPQGFSDAADQFNKLNTEYERLKTIGSEGDGVGGFFKEAAQNIPGFSHEISNAQAASQKFEKEMGPMREGLQHWNDSNKQLQQSLGLTADQVDAVAQKAGIDLKGKIEETVPAVTAFYAQLKAGTPASNELKTSLEGVEDKTKTAKEKFDDFTQALRTFFDVAFGMGSAEDQLQSKLNQLPDILSRTAFNFNATTNESIAYREQMRGITQGAGDLIQEWVRQGVTGDELRARIGFLTASLVDQAVKMGLPRAEAEKYFGQLSNIASIPGLTTNVTAPGAVDAANQLGNVNYQLGQIPGQKNIDVNVRVHGGTSDAYGGMGAVLRDPNTPEEIKVAIAGPNWRQSLGQKDGGLVFFAGGGEHHVAQIAGAGDWRVWAEPETGGEAYIPLGASKRQRSTQILADVASRFGYHLSGSAGGPGGAPIMQNLHQDQRTFNFTFPNYVGDKAELARVVTDEVRKQERSSAPTRSA